MAGPWVPDGDRIRCELHKLTFARTSTCGECEVGAIDFSLVEDREPLPVPPPGCLDSHAIEARFVFNGDLMSNAARDLLNSGDPDWSIAIKMIAESTKAYRAAGECARSREIEHAVEVRMRKLTALKSGKVRH